MIVLWILVLLMCCNCKPYRNTNTQLVHCRYGVDRTRANRPLTFQSHDGQRSPSNNREIKIPGTHATLQGIQVPTDSCISCIGSVELRNVKVVKPTGSYWGDLMNTHVSFEVTVPSTLIVTN